MTGSRREMVRARAEGGFTLLEVMVALAILALALTVISQAQQSAMRQVLRAKKMTVASMLARGKMVEMEDQLFEEGFSDFEDEETGDFGDEGFKNYTFRLKVDKIEIPTSVDGNSLGDMMSGFAGGGSGSASAASGAGNTASKIGGKMLGRQFEMFRNVLEQAIRRVSLEVAWKEGRRRRTISVVTYFTDPRKVAGASGTITPQAVRQAGQGGQQSQTQNAASTSSAAKASGS